MDDMAVVPFIDRSLSRRLSMACAAVPFTIFVLSEALPIYGANKKHFNN